MGLQGRQEISGRVREARHRDLDRVAALWSAITEHHAPIDPLWTMRAGVGDELRALLGDLLRDAGVAIFVYEERGDLPGLCIVRIDRSPPILEETRRAEITDIGVREDCRRQGIASALLGEALHWVDGQRVSRVEVQVARANAEGQAFWRARGFDPLMDVLHKRL